jgi:hypothetical protein
MALDNIFTYATSIDLSESKTIYRAISNGGVGRTMSASPLFYYMDVAMRPLYLAEYKLIQNDMRELDYGVNIVECSLPYGFTYTANTITTAPTVNTSNAQGTTIAVSTGHNLEAGDWVQFTYSDFTERGARKAYQLTSVTASSITLNTGLILPPAGAPALGSDIITGTDIVFRVIAQDIPMATSTPGRGGDPLYSFGASFKFREVL